MVHRVHPPRRHRLNESQGICLCVLYSCECLQLSGSRGSTASRCGHGNLQRVAAFPGQPTMGFPESRFPRSSFCHSRGSMKKGRAECGGGEREGEKERRRSPPILAVVAKRQGRVRTGPRQAGTVPDCLPNS